MQEVDRQQLVRDRVGREERLQRLLLAVVELDRLGPPQIRPPTVYACEWCDLTDRPRVIIDNDRRTDA